ncbi:MAG: class I SAM-dependent methyltransferase [Alphaproteobacteria bacterium]
MINETTRQRELALTLKAENGIVVGNVDAKYQTKNPIARRMMQGFMDSARELALSTDVRVAHEIGCGEGHLTSHFAEWGFGIRACDFSAQIVEEARTTYGGLGIEFNVKSVYDLDPTVDGAPLIVCCEVLEHLEEPECALQRLRDVSFEWCLMSVPREPIWRLLNMARGKYLDDLGNTPGHLQHWGKQSFLALISQYFEVVAVRSPLPWTMVLCRRG